MNVIDCLTCLLHFISRITKIGNYSYQKATVCCQSQYLELFFMGEEAKEVRLRIISQAQKRYQSREFQHSWRTDNQAARESIKVVGWQVKAVKV